MHVAVIETLAADDDDQAVQLGYCAKKSFDALGDVASDGLALGGEDPPACVEAHPRPLALGDRLEQRMIVLRSGRGC